LLTDDNPYVILVKVPLTILHSGRRATALDLSIKLKECPELNFSRVKRSKVKGASFVSRYFENDFEMIHLEGSQNRSFLFTAQRPTVPGKVNGIISVTYMSGKKKRNLSKDFESFAEPIDKALL
jgi:hypothetical protein